MFLEFEIGQGQLKEGFRLALVDTQSVDVGAKAAPPKWSLIPEKTCAELDLRATESAYRSEAAM